ncbi:MAG TPA: DNA repair protein RecO [Vicinamibacterales bacterium]|nr:DNA repair protein RecO [Vicinamibacterales bacterium]
MRSYSGDALVLRTYRYGEADRIVVFLTEDRGKKRGVAKNATKSRRRFGAALEPLTRGRAAYVEHETRELVRLDRIEPRVSPLAASAALESEAAARVLGHAAYFAELLDEWSPENAANERLFRLGASVALALCEGGAAEPLGRYFEYWLLRLEGVYPAIDACPRCAKSLAAGAVLSQLERAYLCAACSHGGVALSSPSLSFLKAAGRRTPADAGAAQVEAGVLRELERAHERLIAMHLDKELRSARVMKELRPGQ